MSEQTQVDIVQQLLLARRNLVEQWNALATQMWNVMQAILLVEEKMNQIVNENAKLRRENEGLMNPEPTNEPRAT
jgi:regulator of replication initiation timing